MENEFIYTPADIAEILHLSMPTVYQQISCGAIPSLKFGRKIVIPRAAFVKKLEIGNQGTSDVR